MTKLTWLVLLFAVIAALFVLWHLLPQDVKDQLQQKEMREPNLEKLVEDPNE